MQIRLEGAGVDLHAADARYHENCYKTFTSSRNVKVAQRKSIVTDIESDEAVEKVISAIKSSPDKMWNSVELHRLYQQNGGFDCNRSRLLNKVKENLQDEVMLFSSPGVATVIMLKSKAVSTLKFETLDDDDETYAQVKFVAKKIVSETKHIESTITKSYSGVDRENIFDVSQSLLDLLSCISKNLHLTLPAAMIGSIITSIISSKPTMLQVALSLVAHSKGLIEHFHQYGVTSSYHELRRFKVSAAAKNVQKSSFTDFKAEDGLIQVVTDNFDANIHTQNGLKQTHAMATIITQPSTTTAKQDTRPLIPRLKQEELKDVKLNEMEIHFFKGIKKPPMPKEFCNFNVLPLKVLCEQVVLTQRAQEEDFQFTKCIITSDNTPDYNGFNMKRTRETDWPK